MKNKKGYIILEALLAIVVLSMIVLAVVPMLSYLMRRTARSRYEPQASLLIQEGVEASYNIFTSNWSGYGNGKYEIGKNAAGKWQLFPLNEDWATVETNYKRKIEIYHPCLNGQGEVVEEALCVGKRDVNTRVVKVTVGWEEEGEDKDLTAQLLLINFVP